MNHAPDFLAASQPNGPVLLRIAITELGARILKLRRGERLTLIGIGCDRVRDVLEAASTESRSALVLDPRGGDNSEKILDDLLNDLADLALDRWPRWYGRDELTADGLIDHATTDRLVSAPWLRAAVKRIGTGYRPRFRKAAKAIEFAQLMRALDPSDPVLIAPVDPVAPMRAAPIIHALEWCMAQGASVAVTLPSRPAPVPPYDRVLYSAAEVIHEIETACARFIPARGRAHHASAIEQRVEAALRRDLELAPLFLCNETVSVAGFGSPRVDLLWREGRVVVELDGPDHQDDPKFANDRHRDYELLVAGYLVLRITNDQVETDLQRTIEKIRAVVRFRQSIANI